MNRNGIIANCKKYLGKPYVWGGESMEEGGYDCSGYAYNVLRDSGYNVNRTTAQGYSKLGTQVPYTKAEPGDLLFFGKSTSSITHIAIYAGSGNMYESIGGSKNTKYNPGKGVCYSKVSRRNDLILVKNIVGDSNSNNTSTASSTTTANVSVPRTWLQKGDKGEKVKTMQLMLVAIGYSCGKNGVDGNFGNDTYKAVTNFQKENGLKADGFYGDVSKKKLEELYNKKVSTTTTTKNFYKVGQVYTLQAEMKVRKGPGTNYAAKTHFMLTKDGQNHDADGDGALDKGTKITCKEVKTVGNDTWIKSPSGWIAAIYNGKVYVK